MGQAGYLVGVAAVVVPAQHVFAVGEGLEAVRIHGVDFEAVLSEFEVVYHFVLEHVADIGT